MKNVYTFRLSEEAMGAMRKLAKERGISTAGVIEWWAGGGFSTKSTVEMLDTPPGKIPPSLVHCFGPVKIAEPTLAEKKARAMEALANIGKRPVEEVPLTNVPAAPFEYEENGEKFRVAEKGSVLGIWWIAEDGLRYQRALKPGELEQLWERRIK